MYKLNKDWKLLWRYHLLGINIYKIVSFGKNRIKNLGELKLLLPLFVILLNWCLWFLSHICHQQVRKLIIYWELLELKMMKCLDKLLNKLDLEISLFILLNIQRDWNNLFLCLLSILLSKLKLGEINIKEIILTLMRRKFKRSNAKRKKVKRKKRKTKRNNAKKNNVKRNNVKRNNAKQNSVKRNKFKKLNNMNLK